MNDIRNVRFSRTASDLFNRAFQESAQKKAHDNLARFLLKLDAH